MNILIIISVFFLFVQKHLIPHSCGPIFYFHVKMLKTKQNGKKNKKKKKSEKKIIVHLQRYALEIFKSHLHMQKINRF